MAGAFTVLNPIEGRKKKDYPPAAFVKLLLTEWGRSPSGDITISADLTTEVDIDLAIDQLHKDLDTIREEAKRILRDQEVRIRGTANVVAFAVS